MLSSCSVLAYGLNITVQNVSIVHWINLTRQDQSDNFVIHWLNKTIHAAIKLMYYIG